jgi:signal transduction histidine kinase
VSRRLVPIGIVAAFSAVLISYLVYTWQIAEELRRDAAVFSRIYFQVVQAAASPEGLTTEGEFQLLLELYDLGIPVVQTDLEGNPTLVKNLPFQAALEDTADVARVKSYVERLDLRNPPLMDPAKNFEVHYGEPLFLRRLKWIPWLQAALLLGVVGSAIWMIRTSARSERERIWTAMARESAHQMGTPLSSLVGWLEMLEGSAPAGSFSSDGLDLLSEMEADVRRLEKVSRRFEFIGIPPTLRPVNVTEILERLGSYFEARLPSLGGPVRLELTLPAHGPRVLGNETLLEWAFENLFKNAVDSVGGGEGTISVSYEGIHGERAAYRFQDDGPGIRPDLRDRLFEVGATSKAGGWGVGLSLARRIFVDMHGGSVDLEHSERGATFLIALPLYEEEA